MPTETDNRPIALVWLRRDLRLADNPALHLAIEWGMRPLLVYVDDPESSGAWREGAAARAWLRRSLAALALDVQALGGRLVLRRGDSLEHLVALAEEVDAAAVLWNRRYEPAHRAFDTRVKDSLRERGLQAESCHGSLLFEPWTLQTRSGEPYRVFSPFWRNTEQRLQELAPPLPAPDELPPVDGVESLAADEFIAAPEPGWDAGFWALHEPGEQAAWRRFHQFIEHIEQYQEHRDRPDLARTSRLSAHLAFGEITPRQLLLAVRARGDVAESKGALGFIRELGWREFSYHLLFHFPDSTDADLTGAMFGFPWGEVEEARFTAWKRGMTGIPMVDAGMRELWATGTMHNRVRMLVASFLTKNLRYHWHHGACWFWDTLVDADLANNTQGWQWSAGTGADAAPYFRIFNPVSQGKRFDPDGTYVKTWIPELANVPAKAIHEPWTEPGSIEGDYPHQPIVDLAATRQAALDAWQQGKEFRSMLRD